MVFEENFLRLIVTVCLKKNEYFKNVKFYHPFYQSINYNNLFVKKQFYVPQILKTMESDLR